jgi:hypothetical protein
MLLFHRPFTDDTSVPGFRLSTAGMPVEDAKQLIGSHYRDCWENINCSGLEENDEFNAALRDLHEIAREHIYALLADEFTDAYESAADSADEHHMIALAARISGRSYAQTVHELLKTRYDLLDEVLETIRREGRNAGSHIKA